MIEEGKAVDTVGQVLSFFLPGSLLGVGYSDAAASPSQRAFWFSKGISNIEQGMSNEEGK